MVLKERMETKEEMETFEVDVAGTLKTFTKGRFTVEQALYELLDNSEAAGAGNVLIKAVSGADDKLEEIIVVDDGSGMSAEGLRGALVFAGQRIHHPLEIGEYGVGMKGAGHALAKRWTVVTRDKDGNVSGAFLDFERIYMDQKYVGPFTESAKLKFKELWDEHSLDKNKPGTIHIFTDLKQGTYATATSFIGHETSGGIRNKRRISRRYHSVIGAGSFNVYTCKDNGARTLLEPYDPLRRHENDVEVLLEQTLCHPKTGASFTATITRVPRDSKTDDFGVLYKVAGITACRDNKSLAGLYNPSTPHSYRWQLRMELDFLSKDDFDLVADFTSYKHSLKLKAPGFGDWLRDSPFGKVVTNETNVRRAQAKAEKLRKAQAKFEQNNKRFIILFNNTGKQLCGMAKPYVKYVGTLREFKPGKFKTRQELSKMDNGIIYYNDANRMVMKWKKEGNHQFLRARATQNALYLKEGCNNVEMNMSLLQNLLDINL
jgi:hypothetical protein